MSEAFELLIWEMQFYRQLIHWEMPTLRLHPNNCLGMHWVDYSPWNHHHSSYQEAQRQALPATQWWSSPHLLII